MSSLGFPSPGDLEAYAQPPPPPAAMPAVCGLPSAPRASLGVGIVAAESAKRSRGPSWPRDSAVCELGSGCPNPRRKDETQFAYKNPSRVWERTHQEPRKPPDRTTLKPSPPLLAEMSSSASEKGKKSPAAEVIPEVGGGAYRAPSVDAARPKPSNGGAVAARRINPQMQPLTIWTQMKTADETAAPSTTRHRAEREVEGPEDFREGEDSEGEVELAEVDLEEDGVLQQQAHPWSVVMLVYSLDRPSPSALFDNIVDGWRLKEDFDYSYQGNNKYLVHFGCEADMSRILRGGPWQYEHDPLLIEAYDGMRKVSDYKLDKMRIWVRILDVPMNWRTDAVVKALCVNLGKILQAELNEKAGNYVRVRVEIPVYRPLETSVAMFAKLQGTRTKMQFEIQYEKLPHFCYTCGYLGHQEKSCGRKRKGGLPTGKYSGKLRCSPPRRFGRQSGTVRAKTYPTVFRGLDFSSKSTASSARGRGSKGARRTEGGSVRRQQQAEEHSTGNPAVDELLAAKMEAMSGGSKDVLKEPHAATVGDGANHGLATSGAQSSSHSEPRSSDMIPAMRNLSHEITMANADISDDLSTLGKRAAIGDNSTASVQEAGDLALVPYDNKATLADRVLSGTPKKRRTSGTREVQQSQHEGEVADQEMVDRTNNLEAVGTGAADELTGPAEPRQEQ